MFITINGLEQCVSVPGSDHQRPALLMVSGAGLALSRIASFFERWGSAFQPDRARRVGRFDCRVADGEGEGLVLTPAEQTALAAMPRTVDRRAQATKMYERLRESMSRFDARARGLEYRLPMIFIQGDRYTPTSAVADFERDARPVLARVAVDWRLVTGGW